MILIYNHHIVGRINIIYVNKPDNSKLLSDHEYIYDHKSLQSNKKKYTMNGPINEHIVQIKQQISGPTLFLKSEFMNTPEIIKVIINNCRHELCLVHYFSQWIDQELIIKQVCDEMMSFALGFYLPDISQFDHSKEYSSIEFYWLYGFFKNSSKKVIQLPYFPVNQKINQLNLDDIHNLVKLSYDLELGRRLFDLEENWVRNGDLIQEEIDDKITKKFTIIYCHTNIEYREAFQWLKNNHQAGLIFNRQDEVLSDHQINTIENMTASPIHILNGINYMSDEYDGITIVFSWSKAISKLMVNNKPIIVFDQSSNPVNIVFNDLMDQFSTSFSVPKKVLELTHLLSVTVPLHALKNVSKQAYVSDILANFSMLKFEDRTYIERSNYEAKDIEFKVQIIHEFLSATKLSVVIRSVIPREVLMGINTYDSNDFKWDFTSLTTDAIEQNLYFIFQLLLMLYAKDRSLKSNYEQIVFD